MNHKKREAKKREEQVQLERTTSGVNQYYGMGSLASPRPVVHDPRPAGPIRTVIALGVIGSLGYYIYWSKKGGRGEEQPSSNPQRNDPFKTNKFEMD